MRKLIPTAAELRAKLKQERAVEAAQAMEDYRAAEIASRANMYRLRTLRLATHPSAP